MRLRELTNGLDASPAERWGEMIGQHPMLLLAGVAFLILAVFAGSLLALRWAGERREAASIVGRLAPRAGLLFHVALGLLLGIAVLGFVALAKETTAGTAVEHFDVGFARAVGRSADPGLRRVMFVVTQFGSTVTVALVGLAVALYLHARGLRILMLGWTSTVAGGLVLNWVLKALFERMRPTLSAPFYPAVGWSFPSGHAMSALVTAGMAAYLVIVLRHTWTDRLWGTAAALGWAWLIGFSRLYLGVHYPSDVLAGYVAAAVWLAASISTTELARRRSRRGDGVGTNVGI
jgi:membrane-associated phospholipid phosphatase